MRFGSPFSNSIKKSSFLVYFFFFLIFLNLTVTPAVFAEDKEASPGSVMQLDVSLTEKPLVRVTPGSPVFIIRSFWESVQLFFRSSSRGKALLALQFSGQRLGEAVQVATRKENVEKLEKIYKSRAELLEKSYKYAGDDEVVREELLQQLILGEDVLEKSKENYTEPQSLARLQELISWRADWVQSLGYGLSDEAEGVFDVREIYDVESSLSTSADVQGVSTEDEDFLIRAFRFIFGTRKRLLSPLKAPRRID